MNDTTYASPFSWRYARPALRELFSERERRKLWRAVWIALAESQMRSQTVHVMPERPTALVDLPPDLDAALAIGLVKDPAERFGSIVELRAAIVAALANTLDDDLRARGEDLIARHPWGAVRT